MQKYVLSLTDCVASPPRHSLLSPVSWLFTDLLLLSCVLQVKGLDVDSLYISHIQVNQAQKQRRRTYRAHGRINRECLLSIMKSIYYYFASAIYNKYLFFSLHVISLPYWVDFVWEGRTCQEGGSPSKHSMLKCIYAYAQVLAEKIWWLDALSMLYVHRTNISVILCFNQSHGLHLLYMIWIASYEAYPFAAWYASGFREQEEQSST